MKKDHMEGIGILKTIWRQNEAGAWLSHDLKALNLKPREGFGNDYFKIKNEFELLTQTPGPVFDNLFSTFGTTEFLVRQSIVPVVAWNEGDTEARSIGTGFFISASGLLLTAAHVIRDPVDEEYSKTTRLDENTHQFDDKLRFGIMLPVNPAAKNAPFDVPQPMREAKWIVCPFEWVLYWGHTEESPIIGQPSRYVLDLDIAVCKVRQNKIVGPYQPLNIGSFKTKVGDRAVAIGYAEMKNIQFDALDSYQPELIVSVGFVTTVHVDNITEKKNTTPGPNFEFSAKIPGKMSGGPILVDGGIITKGVVSRSWHGENHASGCLIAPVMNLPLIQGKSLQKLQQEGTEGIAQFIGADI